MESSKNSFDNAVRSRRKLQKIAMNSGFLTVVLTLALLGTNYHLSDLNKSKVDELIQHQNQIEIDTQASLDIKEELANTKAELIKLEKQLKAEKSVSRSLKEKLTATLSLLAKNREKPLSEQADKELQSATSTIIPTESNLSGTIQQPAKNPDISKSSFKKTEPIKSDANDRALKNSTDTSTGTPEDTSLSPQPSPSKPPLKKIGPETSAEKPADNTTTLQTDESSQPIQDTVIPAPNPQEEETAQPLDSKLEAPLENSGSNNASLTNSNPSSDPSSQKQAFVEQQQ